MLKRLVIGLFKLVMLFILFPIIFPMMIMDLVFILGGYDPFKTPITPIREWIAEKLF
jgi:hypothetical protein